MKRNLLWLWALLAILALLPAFLEASDITSGYTFIAGEKNITHTKLNSQLTGASINTSFYTDKSSAAPVAGDVWLFYSVANSAFRKTTLDTLFLSNTNLIVGQGENDLPDTNDFILVFDTSAGLLTKSPLNSIFTNINLIINRYEITNPPPGDIHFLVESNGVYDKIAESNVFNLGYRWLNLSTNVGASNPLTNPPIYSVHATPTNADMLVIWDALHQTNKVTTLEGLITNLPAARPGFTNSDMFMADLTRTNAVNPGGTNPVLSKVTFADFFTNWFQLPDGTVTNTDTLLVWSTGTNANSQATNFPSKVKMSSLIQKFFTNGIPVIAGTGLSAQGLHGLGGNPQLVRWSLICTNATGDGGYAQNDVVPLEYFEDNAGAAVALAAGANATQVFLTKRVANLRVADKNSSSALTLTLTRWNAQCEAIYYP